jgi:hypothetical protein
VGRGIDMESITIKEWLEEHYNIDKPVKVWYGDFSLMTTVNISSFDGCPEIINGNVFFTFLDDYKSLKDFPKEINGNLNYVFDDPDKIVFTEKQIRKVCEISGEVKFI